MKKIKYSEMMKLAAMYTKNKISWHHHFLTSKCVLNTSKKFQIILENEKTREVFVSLFKKKPMRELKVVESLFFKRK